MLTASTFAIHVTYTCPLTCAHCCFGSSPSVKDRLDSSYVLNCIDELPDNIQMVAFTGGEPFLQAQDLPAFIARAKARGFSTRVVTSAYFGNKLDYARKRIGEVHAAGLDELSISWDDYHEEFVAFDAIRNVATAAIERGITTAINTVQSASTAWPRERILKELGELGTRLSVVCESQLNRTGRAEDKLRDEPLKQHGYLGPCPYVMTGPTLSAKGKLLACCGVIPDTRRLAISEQCDPGRLKADFQQGFRNSLFQWLFLRGPYALITEISKQDGTSPPPADSIGGNCEACKIALTDDRYNLVLDRFLSGRAESLQHELLLLESLGMLTPAALSDLWRDQSHTRHHP